MNIKAGTNINGVKLSNLGFANDLILFVDSEEKLRNLLEDLNEQGKKDEIKLNKKKTKIMCNGISRRQWRGVQIVRSSEEFRRR